MTTTVAISVAASVIASVLVIIVVLLARRRPPEPKAVQADDDLSLILAELTQRMDAMGREVSEALARTQEESRRSRVLGELGGTIDLDEVLNRTLDAAGALHGVDGVLVNVIGPGGEPVSSSVGITSDEAVNYAVGEVPTGRKIRSLALDYGEPEGLSPGDFAPIRSGLAVPVHGELETVGLLSVFSRTSSQAFATEMVTDIEALAVRAGPAIENARRFREARHQADLDALTGLHNRRYFHETLARETARAQRYSRHLALIVFDLDNFKAINDRIGHLAGDSVLAEVADRVREVVRHADIACRVGGDEFAVILPEATLADAEQLYRRIQSAVSLKPISHAGQLLLSAGIAEVRAQDDPVAFFQRADEALYRAKGGGKGRVASEPAAGLVTAPQPLFPQASGSAPTS